MTRRALMAVAAILVLLTSSGCIFEPRKAEQPGQGEEDKWIVPNTPKDVFRNLKSGFASKNNSNYDRSLDVNFAFTGRPEDVANLPAGALDNWTKDVELDFLSRLKGDYVGARMVQFGDENGKFEKEDIEVGTAVFEGAYIITLDAGEGFDVETYAGIARFTVVNGTQGWVLTSWEDRDIDGNYSTGGYLRGRLRS
jgi:hypothetical protein